MTDLETIGKQIDETRHLLKKNTDKLIERDSHLDDIERQTANLELNSNRFKINTRNVKRRMIFQYYSCYLFIILILFFIIFIVIAYNSKK